MIDHTGVTVPKTSKLEGLLLNIIIILHIPCTSHNNILKTCKTMHMHELIEKFLIPYY